MCKRIGARDPAVSVETHFLPLACSFAHSHKVKYMQGHCKTRAATVPDMHRHSHRTRRVAGLFSHKRHTLLPTQGT